jgi:transcriptional regulator with XRE-family HTH domain
MQTKRRLDVPGRLRALIKKDGRSIAQLAVATDMDRNYLYAILSGTRPNPTVATVHKILSCLGRQWRDLE